MMDWLFKGRCISCYGYRNGKCAVIKSPHCGHKMGNLSGCKEWLKLPPM